MEVGAHETFWTKPRPALYLTCSRTRTRLSCIIVEVHCTTTVYVLTFFALSSCQVRAEGPLAGVDSDQGFDKEN